MTNYNIEHKETRKKNRWKEIRYLYTILQSPEYSKYNIEKAMCSNNNDQNVSIEHFLVIIIGEYGYTLTKQIERTIRKIHNFFDINTFSDWRYVYSSLQCLKFYKLIKFRPKELLLIIFDIFSINDGDKLKSNTNNDEWYIYNISQPLREIFMLPVITEQEEMLVKEEFISMLCTISQLTGTGTMTDTATLTTPIQATSSASSVSLKVNLLSSATTHMTSLHLSSSSSSMPSLTKPSHTSLKIGTKPPSHTHSPTTTTHTTTMTYEPSNPSDLLTTLTTTAVGEGEGGGTLGRVKVTRTLFRRVLENCPRLVEVWADLMWSW